MSSVLIVEDEPAIRSQYAEVLQKRGYTVYQARNAEEGLAKLAVARPDLIILDLLLPGPNGVAFLKAADMSYQYPETKVLVASNVDSPEFNRELEELKVTRVVTKSDYTPFRIADLVHDLLHTK